jgi:hypothetical protein
VNSRVLVVYDESTFIIEEPSKLGQAVKLLFAFEIRPSRVSTYGRYFVVSLIPTTKNSGVFVLIRQQPLPSAHSSIHYSFITLPFEATHLEMQISYSRTAENFVTA